MTPELSSPQDPVRPALSSLIHPVPPEVFKADYWEKRPLILLRDNRDYYRPLLSLSDLDEILVNSPLNSSVRLVKDGKQTPVRKLAESGDANRLPGQLEAVYQEYRNGSTIVLPLLHERWPALRTLCQSLVSELSAGVQINVYLTPPHASGLGTHYDTHDVFVLQAHGSKQWQIFGSPVPLPLPDDPYMADKGLDAGDPIEEVVLNQGDCLYLPRGYLHKAASIDATSLHLTVGVKPLTWASIVQNAVRFAIDRNPRLREALVPGFATDDELRGHAQQRLAEILASLPGEIEPGAVIDDARTEALLAREPSLAGHLVDLDAKRFLDLHTPVRRRADIDWSLEPGDGDGTEDVSLLFHGKRVSMPAHLESDLRFILSVEEFTAEELPDDLDAESRVLFVNRLLTEGFLTLSR